MAYEILAQYYDTLMDHVDYEPWIHLLSSHIKPGELVLDLACGTGLLAAQLVERGYNVIATDASEAMLMEARQKTGKALFLHQRAEKLDLYGTVRAAVCSLDGMNYIINRESFAEALRRVQMFLEPGCPFIFDIKTPDALCAMDGRSFVSQGEDVFCAWESSWREPLCRHEITLFIKSGALWRRVDEIHMQRAYSLEFITAQMHAAGFSEVYVRHDILPEQGRIFILGWK